MSALPPKADIIQHGGIVRFVPKADIGKTFKAVSPTQQSRWPGDPLAVLRQISCQPGRKKPVAFDRDQISRSLRDSNGVRKSVREYRISVERRCARLNQTP
jgi:hypothetical protein